MENDWHLLSLNEAGVELLDCVHKTPSFTEEGYPYIAIPQLKGGHLELEEVRRISGDDYKEWTKKTRPQANDVVVSRRCNPGESAHVPDGLEFALGQNLVLLRANGKMVLPEFLRWLVQSSYWWEQVNRFLNVGAVFDSLRCADIPNFKFNIPPLDEQRVIAKILASLDNKIEINRRINKSLESIACAIFKSWFVNFDPVRENAEGRQPFGMANETASLFPSEFEDSDLGEIPKGWKVMPLDSIASFLNGLALQKYPANGEEYLPVIKIAELRNGITPSSGRASLDVPSDYIIEDGDVVFSWSGSLECVVWCGGRGALNQHLFKVSSREYPKWFYYHWIHRHLPEFRAIAAGKATTMGHIQRGHLHDALVVVPPSDLMKRSDEVFSPLLSNYIVNNLESRTLASIRDALLPKLLSGEVRAAQEGAEVQ